MTQEGEVGRVPVVLSSSQVQFSVAAWTFRDKYIHKKMKAKDIMFMIVVKMFFVIDFVAV